MEMSDRLMLVRWNQNKGSKIDPLVKMKTVKRTVCEVSEWERKATSTELVVVEVVMNEDKKRDVVNVGAVVVPVKLRKCWQNEGKAIEMKGAEKAVGVDIAPRLLAFLKRLTVVVAADLIEVVRVMYGEVVEVVEVEIDCVADGNNGVVIVEENEKVKPVAVSTIRWDLMEVGCEGFEEIGQGANFEVAVEVAAVVAVVELG